MKLPLAWLQLSYEKSRLLIALAGIAFADMLMFIQLGFQYALLESSVTLHKKFNGDVFLMSPQSDSSIALKTFSRRRLYQAAGVEGVKSINPIYLDFSIWKNPVTRQTRSLMVLGFNPRDNILNIPEVENNLDVIKLADFVIFDELSRPEFGPIPELFQENNTVKTEVNQRQVTVAGLFPLGASFAADGAIITSDLNFLRIFPNRDPGLIEIGMITLESDANVEAVVQTLREKLPKDVNVFSREEFIAYERNYWATSTAIGFIFSMGTGIGFIVGIVIVYQILYTDVADHLPEYATLKAMGYPDKYFVILVFQQAFILAILGYIPGFIFANLLYFLAANSTNLPIIMTLSNGLTVLILTIIMCCTSGTIAVRKLRAADPADIF